MNIYLPHSTPEELAYIENALEDGILLFTGETVPEDYHVLITGRPSAKLLKAKSLHSLLIPFAGLPSVTKKLIADHSHISVYNLHHNAHATAEMALTLLLACSRLIVPADQSFRKHDWTHRTSLQQMVLHQRTALILGYGAIGKAIKPVLQAMGMNVLAVRRSESDPAKNIYSISELNELLPKAEVVIVALPATAETENLLGREEFTLMPTGAIVVNIGRASVIDQHAFYDALKSGKLHAGASDVWYHYPDKESIESTPPADVPFHLLENFVMSPHRAGAFTTDYIKSARSEQIADLINTLAKGEQPAHEIDLERGY